MICASVFDCRVDQCDLLGGAWGSEAEVAVSEDGVLHVSSKRLLIGEVVSADGVPTGEVVDN